MALTSRIKRAWELFRADDPADRSYDYGPSQLSPSVYEPEVLNRPRIPVIAGDKTIVTSIYNKLSMDVAGIAIRHVDLDEQGRYKNDSSSHLNRCLTLAANLDQSPSTWRQDVAMTMFTAGCAVLVPVKTDVDPKTNLRFDVHELRVGEVVNWYADEVRIKVYNQKKGQREEIVLPKRCVAIAPNPLYSVMNAPNSTLQRLVRKLQLLDVIDEQSGSGKLDLIIQLPYSIRSESRRNQAERRKEEIEFQLRGSKYGIAYTDGTEKITQLNRPAENNLLQQVEFLVAQLYTQLGLTPEIMNGTADEATMLNFINRIIEPVVKSITESMQMAFLGSGGTRRNERIMYFRDPFKLVPLGQIAEAADKLTRNEIVTANEFRGFLGLPPSSDKKADELRNSNMPADKREAATS